ncbi:MAG: ribosome biogenesis factor YjgA [Kofleriaceae bacterium]
MDSDDTGETRRQQARRKRRQDGDQSARVARALMLASPSTVARLELDEGLRGSIDRARKVTALIARRREERRLAGDLRRVDLDALEVRLANVQKTGSADPGRFQRTEAWRTRLLEVGAEAVAAFVAEFPSADAARLTRMVDDARRERATTRPPGAGRALFRALTAAIAEADVEAPDAADDDDDDA